MSETPTTTPPSAAERRDGLGAVSIVVAACALFLAVLGVAFGMRAIDEADDRGSAGVTAAATVPVDLTEFAIDPSTITVAEGGALAITNRGSAVHNLSVKGTDIITADVNPGDSETLSLASLGAGEYTVICAVVGHEAAGMTATLTVTGAGGVAVSPPGHDTAPVDFEQMDRIMRERTLAFPAETSAVGAQEMAPEIAPDGAKVFELTASVFDWEIEPDVWVEAWGYNQQVPGPTIRVEVGDLVRIVLNNELQESTILHSHGFTVPNSMDGVPDITQDPVKPGESFVYEFIAREPMVGMYHSHHHGEVQVPNGLLGAFYAGDMPLPPDVPTPAVDMPLILNDAGTIGLSLNGKSFPATAPVVAETGDWIKLDYMNEGLTVHPMHLHGMPQLVIAKDGYPLANPQYEDTVTVAPGERISVLVHATEPGVWAWHCHILTHAEREDGMFGMVTALVVQ